MENFIIFIVIVFAFLFFAGPSIAKQVGEDHVGKVMLVAIMIGVPVLAFILDVGWNSALYLLMTFDKNLSE